MLPDVELYIRDTMLDTGRGVNTDGATTRHLPDRARLSLPQPEIKVDVPTPAGYQTATTDIDFLTSSKVILDDSDGVGTNTPPPTVHNRVYAEVHNRGRVDATNVQVMAVVTNAGTGLALPVGYTANVVAGTPLPGPKWVTLGTVTIPAVRAGLPQVAPFDLPSTVLPLPASLPGSSHWCMAVFLHGAQDPFTSTIPTSTCSRSPTARSGSRTCTSSSSSAARPPRASARGRCFLSPASTSRRGHRRSGLRRPAVPGLAEVLLPPPLCAAPRPSR